MNLPDDDDDDAVSGERLATLTESLRQQAAEARARPCATCGCTLCGHEALLNVVLGSRHAAHCLDCLALEHGEPATNLTTRAIEWIRRRECYLHVWHLAGDEEHGCRHEMPPCMRRSPDELPVTTNGAPAKSAVAAPPIATSALDAGQLGCGELVLQLRFRMQELLPGDVLHVTAHDPAAPIDLPAWCGLTGHTMLHLQPPHYWIRRKETR